jgi:hypothetical protein
MTAASASSVTISLNQTELLVTVIEVNLQLLAVIVQPLLATDGNTLTVDGEALCKSVDNTIYLSGLSVLNRLSQLEEQAAALTREELDSCLRLHRRFDELTTSWKELMQAVHHTWKLGKPTN